MPSNNFTLKNRILLLLCTVFYAATIASIVFSNRIAILLFLILHSGSILFYIYLQNTNSDSAVTEFSAMTSNITSEHETLIESLTEKVQSFTTTITSQKKELQSLSKENAELKAELTFKNMNCKDTAVIYDSEGLLPPVSLPENTFDPIDIIAVAGDTIQELSYFAECAKIQVQISSNAQSILVKADSSRIRILFRNIIDNSIKYMKRAGSLVITISNIGTDIFIVCKDNGNGLAEQEAAHVFELNYQGSNRISGNGLGLTQAKAIVEFYGGTIYAKSTLGAGMGIYIQLPTD